MLTSLFEAIKDDKRIRTLLGKKMLKVLVVRRGSARRLGSAGLRLGVRATWL